MAYLFCPIVFSIGKITFCLLPVDYGKPVMDIIASHIIILEIIGMFPYIDTENGPVAGRKKGALIVGGAECQLIILIQYQPGISGAEYREGSSSKQVLKIFKTAELPCNEICQLPGRLGVITFFQQRKIKDMVVRTSCIVQDRTAYLGRHIICITN